VFRLDGNLGTDGVVQHLPRAVQPFDQILTNKQLPPRANVDHVVVG